MTTPRGAVPDDFAQWRKHVERQLRNLAALASYRPGLRVDVGDFQVSGGGSIIVNDGGNVLLNDGGAVEVRGDGALRWFDEDEDVRVYIGQMIWEDSGDPAGQGLLVQQAFDSGTGGQRDLLSVSEARTYLAGPGGGGWLTLGGTDHDNFALRRNNGNLLFDVWNSDDGPALKLFRFTEKEILSVGQTWFRYANGEDNLFGLDKQAGNTVIWGGPASNGVNFRAAIVMVGGDNNNRVIRMRDGANNTFIPAVASDWRTGTSWSTHKNIDGDLTGALADVRRTPIKRWRYKPEIAADTDSFGTSETDTAEDGDELRTQSAPFPEPIGPKPLPRAEDMPEHIGPMLEDAPAQVAVPSDDALSMSGAVWTLWSAVQELSQQVDTLQARLDALEG